MDWVSGRGKDTRYWLEAEADRTEVLHGDALFVTTGISYDALGIVVTEASADDDGRRCGVVITGSADYLRRWANRLIAEIDVAERGMADE